MLDAANSDKRLLESLRDTFEAQAFEVVRFSLMQSLLMQTVRCWDGATRDRASLLYLAELLAKPGMSDALAERESENQDPAVRTRLEALLEGINGQTSGDQKARQVRVKNYRDHFIAHNLMPKLATRAVDSDVHSLLDVTVQLVDTAHLIVVGRDADLGGWRDVNAEYVRMFWSSFRVGQR
jgi:hypothetical protein